MKEVDMSSEAITRRLRQASQLRDLSLSLMKAKRAHDAKVLKEQEAVKAADAVAEETEASPDTES
ncbi:MAG TPA: hypothetical protein VHL50_01660 [Pyrinomonadaceae bacterium]|nr:hypothetical protein [Pyrinomonadaceae bacterium]